MTKAKTTKIPKTQERKASLVGADVDADSRTVRAALSSEQPVDRIFGREILVHTPKAIDLGRAEDNGLPLLINHNDISLPVGRVQNIGLDRDRVLRGDLTFSEGTQDARDAWALVEDGTLSDVSIRYRIKKIAARESDTDDVRVTKWELQEASVVSVPADPTVGIGRSNDDEDLGGIDMPEDDKSADEPTKVKPSASRSAGRDEGVRAERQRMTDIDDIAANFPSHAGVADLCRQAKEDGWSVEHFKDEMIREVAGTPAEPSRSIVPQSRSIVPGADSREKMEAAILEALEYRAGVYRDNPEAEAKARQNEFSSYGMIEIGRRFLESGHVSTRGMNPTDVAGAMLTRFIDPGTVPATGISTYFPDLLENVGNKMLFQGFSEAPTTYQLWTGTASSRDFKPGTMPGISHFTSLTVNAENAAIADGKMEDKKEGFQVQTYAAKYALTRQALVNDDLGGFGDVARKMGIAAGRTLDEQVYAFIVANGNMTEDGNPLFDPTHNNLVTTSGPPSTANISTARSQMGRQTDWNSIILGIVPQYMVVPLELERTMLELQSVITGLDPDATGQMRDNVYRQMWSPVATPRLASAEDWYMFGARGEHINVVYLNDQRSPMLARDEGWSILSAHWRVVFDFDVMAADWRSAIKFDSA